MDVCLIERHRLVREGTKNIIESIPDFRVVGEADDGPQAIKMIMELRPPMVVTGIKMANAGITGVEICSKVTKHLPDTRIVVLSSVDDESVVVKAFKAGVHGYILKSCSAVEFTGCLRDVARGASYISPNVASTLNGHIHNDEYRGVQTPSILGLLSNRELQILRLIAQGKQNKDIGPLLDNGKDNTGIAVTTVRSYRRTLMKKTGRNNAAALTTLAIETRLYIPGDYNNNVS